MTTFMASPMSSLNAFLTIPRLPPSQIGKPHEVNFRSYSILPRGISRLYISFARPRNHTDSTTTPLTKKEEEEKEKEPVVLEKDKDEKKEFLKEAFHAFFGDDLEIDDSLIEDDDDEISDEELIKLERELEEAFKNYDEEDVTDSTLNEGGGGGDDGDEELFSKLNNWQLHKLAYALKDDSRKTNIKDLADDLCLDQEVVLKLLSDPILMLMTAALPDDLISTLFDPTEPATTVSDIETYAPEETLNSEDDEEVIIDVTQTDCD